MVSLGDCRDRSLADISKVTRGAVERAQSGVMREEDYTGGTFSISNMGMFDVDSFSAIIYPPQAAVLAVGTVRKQPVVARRPDNHRPDYEGDPIHRPPRGGRRPGGPVPGGGQACAGEPRKPPGIAGTRGGEVTLTPFDKLSGWLVPAHVARQAHHEREPTTLLRHRSACTGLRAQLLDIAACVD